MSRYETGETFYGAELSHVHHAGFTSLAAGAAPVLIRALRAAGFDTGTVVELGCGSGVLASALVEAGYAVIGVDRSPAMLEIARRTAPGAEFVLASMHDFAFPSCAAVFAVGEGLAYIGNEDPRETLPGVFRRIHEALAPGGLFVFDLVCARQGRPQSYIAERSGAGWSVRAEVTEYPEQSLLVRRIRTHLDSNGHLGESFETHRVRTFTRDHVEDMLRSAGFSVRARRSYGEIPLGPGRLAFFARKPSRP